MDQCISFNDDLVTAQSSPMERKLVLMRGPNTISTYRITADSFFSSALAAASFWDYRLFDLRIFDGVALLLLGCYLFLSPESGSGFLRRRFRFCLLFTTVLVYAALGFILHFHRSSLVIIFFAIIGFVIIGRREQLRAQASFLSILIALHVALFIIQFGTFYGFRIEIDYQGILGQTSRIMRSPSEMRAAGVFQEPNSYCLNLFVLCSIAIIVRGNRLLIFIAAITMFLSESLWGIGASIVLLFLMQLHSQKSLTHLIAIFSASCFVGGVIFNIYLWVTKPPNEYTPYFYGRMMEILSDSSLRARYLRNTCSSAEQMATETFSQVTNVLHWTFGEGLSTHYFTQCLPANGIGLLAKSFGIVGIVTLLAGFIFSLRGTTRRDKLYVGVAVIFAFTSYPLITYLIFWFWLPAMIAVISLPDHDHSQHFDAEMKQIPTTA